MGDDLFSVGDAVFSRFNDFWSQTPSPPRHARRGEKRKLSRGNTIEDLADIFGAPANRLTASAGGSASGYASGPPPPQQRCFLPISPTRRLVKLELEAVKNEAEIKLLTHKVQTLENMVNNIVNRGGAPSDSGGEMNSSAAAAAEAQIEAANTLASHAHENEYHYRNENALIMRALLHEHGEAESEAEAESQTSKRRHRRILFATEKNEHLEIEDNVFYSFAAWEKFVPKFYFENNCKVYVDAKMVAFVFNLFKSFEHIRATHVIKFLNTTQLTHVAEVIHNTKNVPFEVPLKRNTFRSSRAHVYVFESVFWHAKLEEVRKSAFFIDFKERARLIDESDYHKRRAIDVFNLPGAHYSKSGQVPYDIFGMQLRYLKPENRDKWILNKQGWIKVIVNNDADKQSIMDEKWGDVKNTMMPQRGFIERCVFVDGRLTNAKSFCRPKHTAEKWVPSIFLLKDLFTAT